MLRKRFALGAILLALAAFGRPAQANLIDAGGLFSVSGQNFGNPAALAAALQSGLHTGPLVFLGQYYFDLTTLFVKFVPGAISDPSLLRFKQPGVLSSMVAWDLTGTTYRMAFVTDVRIEGDFSFVGAERVTPDENLNSLGFIMLHTVVPITFFGKATSVPDAGSTALLLASALAGLWSMRQFSPAHR